MLNEEKIKLMNEIACFEKKEKSGIEYSRRFFRGDYIAKHMLQSFVGYTMCYVLLLLIVMLYSMETIINTVNVFDVFGIFRGYILWYVFGLIAYEIITYAISSKKYDRANTSRKVYLAKLRRLQKRYELIDKSKELSREE